MLERFALSVHGEGAGPAGREVACVGPIGGMVKGLALEAAW
jgi:hypothetical protein